MGRPERVSSAPAPVGRTALARSMNELITIPLAMIGLNEIWPIAIVVLVLFGARKLPELAHAMGSSINQFKRGLDAGKEDEEKPKKIEGGDA